MNRYVTSTAADIFSGAKAWPVWTMLAYNDIRKRYRRSALGQFWLTLTMAVTIFGIGYIYSGLLRAETNSYVPYVATSMIVWTFLSTTVNECCVSFIENESIMRYTYLPRFTFVARTVYRNLIVAAHNLLIIPIVFLVYEYRPSVDIIYLVPGLLLLIGNLVCVGLILAIICARYRDVPQIISSIMTVAFFVTPVMFSPSAIRTIRPEILSLNPFASLLEIARDPLLGQAPSVWAWSCSTGLLVVEALIAIYFVGRYGSRVVYWL